MDAIVGLFKRPKAGKVGFDNDYSVGSELGVGGYAIVKEAIRKLDGEKFAVKIVKRDKSIEMEKLLRNEIAIFRQLDHPNLVKLRDLYESKDHFYLVMDLCTGGELFDRIFAKGRYTEHDAAYIITEITNALAYLHQNNIAHRDLKPENVIFKDKSETSRILVTDFGLSKAVKSNGYLTSNVGTPFYISPEIIQNVGHSTSTDMWSLGVVAYIVLSGYTPFWCGPNNSRQFLFNSIVNGAYDFHDPLWDEVSEAAKNFISRLLVTDPTQRMTAQEAQQHRWIVMNACTDTTSTPSKDAVDLLPLFKQNFNARMALRKGGIAVLAVEQFKAISQRLNQSVAETSNAVEK